MPKPRKTIRVRLPAYTPPRLAWRRALQRAIHLAADERRVQYVQTDRLELRIRLYLDGRALEIHDVDNRLKDVMDALQGRVGGPKSIRPRRALVANDRQVWRVLIEKRDTPWQSRGLGHLAVRRIRTGQGRRGDA